MEIRTAYQQNIEVQMFGRDKQPPTIQQKNAFLFLSKIPPNVIYFWLGLTPHPHPTPKFLYCKKWMIRSQDNIILR